MKSKLLNQLLDQQELEMKHMDMDQEFSFYELVSAGDVENLKKKHFSLFDEGLGKLSDNPLRNIQYHFIISVALIVRLCIENGMDSETGYTLSDLYIQRVDKMTDVNEIEKTHKEMAFDYTARMKALRHSNKYSRHVSKTIDYIENNLDKPLSVSSLSEHFGLSKSYLCTLFKKETDETINGYIEKKRIELAKDYLANTEIPFIEIASSLGFKTLSYFIRIFKKNTGMTVAEYRKSNRKKYL